MKKIILTIAIALVSIVIGIAAFAGNGANASAPQIPTLNAPLSSEPLTGPDDKLERQKLLKQIASNAGVSVQEMLMSIAYIQQSCEAGYDLETKDALDDDQKFTCSIVEDMDLSDYK